MSRAVHKGTSWYSGLRHPGRTGRSRYVPPLALACPAILTHNSLEGTSNALYGNCPLTTDHHDWNGTWDRRPAQWKKLT